MDKINKFLRSLSGKRRKALDKLVEKQDLF